MHMKKKLILSVLIALVILCLTGCGKYASSYKAIAFVHSNTADSAFMSFSSFEGRMVFKLKAGASEQLKYSARLDSGIAVVYYDDGNKTELFTISAGEEIESSAGPLKQGTVYIIIETGEACREGSFRFGME